MEPAVGTGHGAHLISKVGEVEEHQAGGGEYVSGPAARDYIDDQVFRDRDINLTWFDYLGFREYPQLWGDFTHGVTILDLLFNCGNEAHRYMRHVES